MLTYDQIIDEILKKRRDLTKEDLEKMVGEIMKREKFLSKKGAALILAEELSVLKGKSLYEVYTSFTKLSDLVGGLSSVNVIGRIISLQALGSKHDRRFIRFKIGDSSGKLECIAWDEKVDEFVTKKIGIDDIIMIRNGYTKGRVEGGISELHIGKLSEIEKVKDHPDIPKLEDFFLDVTKALEVNDDFVDVRGYVLKVEGSRIVQTKLGERELSSLLISDGQNDVKLLFWGDHAKQVDRVKAGCKILISNVKIVEDEVYTTSRTLIVKVEKDERGNELLNKRIINDKVCLVLDSIKSEYRKNMIISYDGKRFLRIETNQSINVIKGSYIKIRSGFIINKRGKTYVSVDEEGIELLKEVKEQINYKEEAVKIKDVDREYDEAILEGMLDAKTPLSKINTRYGPAETVNFWIRQDDHVMMGSAWREKALEIDKIQHGKKIKLKWVSIRKNPYGRFEIMMDRWSVIEVMDGNNS